LSVALRRGGDTGIPVVVGEPDDPAALTIRAVADGLASTASRGLAGRALPLAPR
ncbi:MAG TPA: sodium:proton antiporter, partial [Microbacterium sp.]|nr:sodium:proton antiporter [Microbacterium sp.]